MGAEVVRAVDNDDEDESASAAARRVTRNDEGFEGAGDGVSTGDADGEGNDEDDNDELVGAADARLDRMVERWAPALPSALPFATET